MEAVKSPEKISEKSSVKEWVIFFIKLIVIYVLITNTLGFTRVSGVSMSPTLKDNSLIVINKFSSHFGNPEYGDVVIVHEEQGFDIIKRVIGVSGDTIEIKDGIVFLNNEPLKETYIDGKPNDMAPVKVQDNKVFIMGDNRTPGESLDSRDPSIGTVSVSSIRGYAAVSAAPFYKIDKP